MIKKILIIDDEVDILVMLRKMMERSGYEVEVAENGIEGMDLFMKSHVDLVITDIIMPDKEGLEIILEMKQQKPELKIIAISGGGRISANSYLGTAEMFGADRTFQKPFSKAEIVGAVRELIG